MLAVLSQAFDPVWENELMTKHEAYQWLSQTLGIPRRDCQLRLKKLEGSDWRVVPISPLHAAALKLCQSDQLFQAYVESDSNSRRQNESDVL